MSWPRPEFLADIERRCRQFLESDVRPLVHDPHLLSEFEACMALLENVAGAHALLHRGSRPGAAVGPGGRDALREAADDAEAALESLASLRWRAVMAPPSLDGAQVRS